MPQKTRFTIYDAMENSGFFAANPANPGSRDNDGAPLYTGPVEYPKMMYHPQGEEKIIVPAEIVMTPLGAREYNEQREMIHQIVQSKEEEEALKEEGWLDHPAKAMEVRIRNYIADANLSDKEAAKLIAKIPKIAISVNREAELLAEIAHLTKLREQDQIAARTPAPANAPAGPKASVPAPAKEPDEDEEEAA